MRLGFLIDTINTWFFRVVLQRDAWDLRLAQWAGQPFPVNLGAYCLLVPVWLFVRMALNAIDGMLAREHHMRSALGGILNELSDVVSDAAIYLPFAMVPGIAPALVVLAVLLAILTEMAGVVAVQIGASRRYDGPMGKSDRAFAFGLLALMLALGIDLGGWANLLLGIVALMLAWTVVNRCRRALGELANAHETPAA